MIAVVLAFFVSLSIALLAVPVFSKIANIVGLVDLPDNKRKLHTSAIPLIGGVAVFLSTLVAVTSVTWFSLNFQELLLDSSRPVYSLLFNDLKQLVVSVRPTDQWELLGLVIGSIVILAVGVLDDRFAIRGRTKLLGQFAAATVLIFFNYHFDQVTFAGFTIKFDVFSIIFVYGWVLAAVNSVNSVWLCWSLAWLSEIQFPPSESLSRRCRKHANWLCTKRDGYSKHVQTNVRLCFLCPNGLTFNSLYRHRCCDHPPTTYRPKYFRS